MVILSLIFFVILVTALAVNAVDGGKISTGTNNINPVGVAVNQAGTKVYVTNSGDDTVSVIDAVPDTVIATVQ